MNCFGDINDFEFIYLFLMYLLNTIYTLHFMSVVQEYKVITIAKYVTNFTQHDVTNISTSP